MGVIIYQGYGEEKEVLYNSYAKKVVGKYLVRKIDEKVGSLVIEKIKMDLPFYEETSKKNNVNQNIFYINTGIKDTFLFAAHSGTGPLAYFNDIRYLEKKDIIKVNMQNKTYTYEVTSIKRSVKNGKLNISNLEGMLYLTTCDQVLKGYQLTVEASLIK